MARVAADAARFVTRCTHEPDGGQEKSDINVGHHAVVTTADVAAQQLIVDRLSHAHPLARFLTEEKAATQHRDVVITDDTLADVGSGDVYGVDPVDGTSMYLNGLWEWSVSIGLMRQGQHVAGAICAPMVMGGSRIMGEVGTGVELTVGGIKHVCHIADRQKKQRVVYVGPDLFFLPQFTAFTQAFSAQVRTTNCTGSCALGLLYVAAGRIDALVQPVQGPWDWFAGYPLVLAAGGKFQFYHYRNGQVVALNKPDLLSYSPTKRNVGFIAGAPDTVDWLFQLLQENWSR